MTTIEELEGLATTLEAHIETKRGLLERLCRAYGRILRARELQLFTAKPCAYGDAAGSWDSSYPPKQEYTDHTGPRALRLIERDTEDTPTSRGFYYDYRTSTTYGGLYLADSGDWLRSNLTGTGRFGQFAAHPGPCEVECTIEWSTVDDDDLSLDELENAERILRAKAFPLDSEAEQLTGSAGAVP